jgi:predicted metal-dependent phosphoesterase TrpH
VPLFDHVRFDPECSYELTYAPMEHSPRQGGWKPGHKANVVPENGRLKISAFFEAEQEHTLIIEETRGSRKRAVGNFRVYSLGADLHGLRPYKGDFHMHSHRSDGVESPAYVAGASRRAGLHFMALTDHRNYAASAEARDAFEGVPVDLRIYPGEEVHTPDNPVHIVSFGANAGITELYRSDASAYRQEVARLMEGLPPTPEGVDRFHYAACVWAAERIRERGGLSMIAHPYWVTGNRHNVEEPLLDHLFATEVFDALELIAGFGWESLHVMDVNALQVARYLEERAKGRRIAVCGISDAHGVERSDAFGRYFTVCFARSLNSADLISAIKEMRSVAVETPGGSLPRAYGPFRLVKFTQYLLREVFPQHDELCFEEGRLMIQHAAGNPSAAKQLSIVQGQTSALYDRYWSKSK